MPSRRQRKKKQRDNLVVSSNTSQPINPPNRSLLYQERTSFSSGPIPAPDKLEAYNAIIPNGADRIMKMAENQALHRQGLEKTVIGGDVARANLGLHYAFLVTLVIFGCGTFLLYNDHNISGWTIIGGDAIFIITAFLKSSNSRKEEREKKNKQNLDLIKSKK